MNSDWSLVRDHTHSISLNILIKMKNEMLLKFQISVFAYKTKSLSLTGRHETPLANYTRVQAENARNCNFLCVRERERKRERER